MTAGEGSRRAIYEGHILEMALDMHAVVNVDSSAPSRGIVGEGWMGVREASELSGVATLALKTGYAKQVVLSSQMFNATRSKRPTWLAVFGISSDHGLR